MQRKFVYLSLLIALTVASSLLVIIPIPATSGFVTLCDAGIFLAGLLFGPLAGLVVGAFSGGLIDLLSGYPQWILFSVLIHGLQGFVGGYFWQKSRKWQTLGLGLGSLMMVIGYALATAFLYHPVAGIASIPTNTVQTFFGATVAFCLFGSLKKSLPKTAQNLFEGEKNVNRN